MDMLEDAMSSLPLPVIPGHRMESMTSTEAKNGFGRAMMKATGGAVVGITRHDEVSAVLLSAETYRTLLDALSERRIEPLEELRDRFDQRFAEMQSFQAKAAAQALFSATTGELGAAAVKGAARRA
jgi:PHD/YefM family antitoxin component YafN of YafNO toxin-antitoxin module